MHNVALNYPFYFVLRKFISNQSRFWIPFINSDKLNLHLKMQFVGKFLILRAVSVILNDFHFKRDIPDFKRYPCRPLSDQGFQAVPLQTFV